MARELNRRLTDEEKKLLGQAIDDRLSGDQLDVMSRGRLEYCKRLYVDHGRVLCPGPARDLSISLWGDKRVGFLQEIVDLKKHPPIDYSV